MEKTKARQALMGERVSFIVNYIGVLIGFLMLSLTVVKFDEFNDGALWLKAFYFFALLFLGISLLFGFVLVFGPSFVDYFNFMGSGEVGDDKRDIMCLRFVYLFFILGLFTVISIVVFIAFELLWVVFVFDLIFLILFLLLFYTYILPKKLKSRLKWPGCIFVILTILVIYFFYSR